MRDTTLLRDMLLYLRNGDAPQGLGRLRNSLIKRLEREIDLDPLEIYKLATTFLILFSNPSSDCQPSHPWERLNGKIRAAVNKKRKEHEESDPLVRSLIKCLLEEEDKKRKSSSNEDCFYPFRVDDQHRKKR